MWRDSESICAAGMSAVFTWMCPTCISSSPSAVAHALGWPDRPITITQLAALALNRTAGWGSIDPSYSRWGRFKIGHGHPNSSNTGRLFFVLAVASFTTNFTPSDNSRLLPQDIASLVVMKGVTVASFKPSMTIFVESRCLRRLGCSGECSLDVYHLGQVIEY